MQSVTGNQGQIELKDHIVRLHSVLSGAESSERLDMNLAGDPNWGGVCYSLQIAASIREVVADITETDISGIAMYGGASAEFDSAHSDLTSRYVRALIVFQFVWTAYEAMRDFTKLGRVIISKNINKTREIFDIAGPLSNFFPFLRSNLLESASLCISERKLGKQIGRTLCANADATNFEMAADLARRFRHHLYHGGDSIPLPDRWDEADASMEQLPIRRLSVVSRLVLMLIQVTAITCLRCPLSPVDDEWDECGSAPSLRARLFTLHIRSEDCNLQDCGSSKQLVLPLDILL